MARTSSPESGFALTETLVAAFVTAVGLLATLTTFDVSRNMVSLSVRKEAAVHLGQQEIERIRALEYEAIALTSAPSPSTDPANPAFYVAGGSAPTYRWNQRTDAPLPHTEPLVVDTSNGQLSPEPTPWNDGRLSGLIYRFVTWVDDSRCGDLCPGAEDYKRVTVAVTVTGDGGPRKPILVSSIASDPEAKPEGYVVDGSENPLQDPSTRCVDSGGALVDCVAGVSGSAKTWFMYDTPASSTVREPIVGNHPTHPTLAPTGACSSDDSTGCPVPDLLGTEPPPAPPDPEPLPPLYTYSTDQTGTYAGGRVIGRDAACDAQPSASDNTRGELWVTPPLAEATTLTGAGALTLHSQTVGGVDAAVTLCVVLYDVPGSIANLVASPPTEIGRAYYSLGTWPTAPAPVAFTFDFRGSSGSVAVPAGHRIGVRIWPAGSSGADIAAIYDHPSYSSSLQLNASDS